MSLMRHAVVVGGAALVLLGPAVGVASAAEGAAAGTGPAAGARAFPSDSWGTAIGGAAAPGEPGFAQVTSLSCAREGNCSAGGVYADGSGDLQAFVVSEMHGTWGSAIEVPGTAALNQGEFAEPVSLSCGGVGNCSAGGYYTDKSGHAQAFVVNQVHGVWGKAIEVPGIAHGPIGGVKVTSVSCARPGNCSAGGYYTDSSGHEQAFVVTELHGTWGRAMEVPGTAALNRGGFAGLTSLSCAQAGDCSAGGVYFKNSSGQEGVFVASQVHGVWGKAMEVPGMAALNQGYEYTSILSVSCASAGNCSAGGDYTDSSNDERAFVVNEMHGIWCKGKAIEVPGAAASAGAGTP
jgi:hypothetical protein